MSSRFLWSDSWWGQRPNQLLIIEMESEYSNCFSVTHTYMFFSLSLPVVFAHRIYLLLTEFEAVTDRVFSSLIYGPSAKCAGHKSKGKKQGSVTYSTDRENEVSKIFIISLVCVWGAQKRFLFTRNGFKFLTHLESKTSPFEIVFKSLARFNT